ncbi:HEAT repeat domain-containing protein [Methanosarcina vacuolata]|uniref:Putative oxidoreductase/HEAT repeat-containing protein n=1 Tax=Methanosarcina vacuolata Z-761 TaxID=1434123 RepID=A0A0E3Q7E1_9EURY|nr:HEAT repeat domain-containing protein [Methanosarcina vacuolata]AKB44813.1 putative oxidoreductase/HEAT repeat-containing protein [Methanosarcina vacuolata Z-761]
MLDQDKIHDQCLREDPKKRIKALEQLEFKFFSLSDKQKAWKDLHVLTNDEYWGVRYKVAYVLGSVFPYLPDKQKAWNDLHALTSDEDRDVRVKAVYALGSAFSQMPDKQKAWKHLIRLTSDEDWRVRDKAASALGSAFSHMPDKQKVWVDLHVLTNDEYYDVRSSAAFALGSLFSQLPDKQKACEDLTRLTKDNDEDVRLKAVYALNSAFSQLPDKQNAWEHLIRLTKDKDSRVRYDATTSVLVAFSQVPDKQKAWKYLIRLTKEKVVNTRHKVAAALGSLFLYVPDKQQVWNDLIKLIKDEDILVRYSAVDALSSVFFNVPDKKQAWNDLIRLTNNENKSVRTGAASVLGSAFSQVPDKQQAWNDLHRLTNDEDSSVRLSAASALGSAFSQVPDEQQAWNDLIKLATDKDSTVRSYANHSLGKVSIFKASQSEKEEDYKNELEKAIDFFEKSARESSYWINPSRFCLPFYRSFHTIIFKRLESKEEVDKYLVEAKNAVEGSKSKELLFEAVENLANALKKVENLRNLNLETMKGEIGFYRQYCDRAAELMRDTEETAPFATVAMRKGLPILDRNLKELLEDIQKKAKNACKESKGTDAEEIACAINREIQTWEIGSQEEMAFNVENLIFTLESNIPRIQENQYIFNRIQQIREQKDVPKQYGIISTIIPLIPKIYMEQKVDELENDIKGIKEKIDYVIISLKPGIKEEIEISVGTEILGTGVTHKITIPLQEISYSELKEDLEKITGRKIDKLSKVPKKLANKIKGYLLLHDKEDVLEKLI